MTAQHTARAHSLSCFTLLTTTTHILYIYLLCVVYMKLDYVTTSEAHRPLLVLVLVLVFLPSFILRVQPLKVGPPFAYVLRGQDGLLLLLRWW